MNPDIVPTAYFFFATIMFTTGAVFWNKGGWLNKLIIFAYGVMAVTSAATLLLKFGTPS